MNFNFPFLRPTNCYIPARMIQFFSFCLDTHTVICDFTRVYMCVQGRIDKLIERCIIPFYYVIEAILLLRCVVIYAKANSLKGANNLLTRVSTKSSLILMTILYAAKVVKLLATIKDIKHFFNVFCYWFLMLRLLANAITRISNS